MKKLLLISTLLFSTSLMFGQFTIHYSGGITNHPATPIMMYLEVDSIIVDSTLTTPSVAGYSDSVNVTSRPFMIRILMTNCHGVQVADWYSPPPATTIFRVPFSSLDYCPPSPCQANFTKHQAIDPITRLPMPNKAIIINTSVGTGLTYSWNFGDGSPSVTGLNQTHTYATHGSYNVCLTVTGTTTSGVCTSIFCDTLTVDSSGNVRSSFTVTTGNSLSSIEELETISEFNLYPNPANDFVKLDFKTTQSSNSTIRIIDLKGSEVMNLTKSINPGSNLITISTADLNEGIYIIQINDGVNQLNKKMQVVK